MIPIVMLRVEVLTAYCNDQGRSWVFVAGGPDNRGAVGTENSTAEGTL
jgi:hypothetical protein